MPLLRILILTTLAMLAFAANALFCRLALKQTAMDAASFTSIRLVSGALVLWFIVWLRRRTLTTGTGNWPSALALFIYAAGFSYAYVSLPAATGALLLFGAVQTTMISYGLWRGERLTSPQLLGLSMAIAGLIALLLPGVSAAPMTGALLMVVAGMAWGIYSLRGRGKGDPTRVTSGNFLRASPITLLLSFSMYQHLTLDLAGIAYAIASGAIASGVGYAIWYTVLPALKATTAASVQLSVPVIAALGGVLLLSEPMTLHLVLASVAILGGIALVLTQGSSKQRGKREV